MASGVNGSKGFWTTLGKWGGEWMWEGIETEQPTYNNLAWLVEGMKAKTLLWVTDGSYNRKQAPDLCGVGWVIICTRTGRRLTGPFLGTNNRGKLLQSRDARPLRVTPLSKGSIRLLPNYRVDGCPML